jgi:hypothetical protein
VIHDGTDANPKDIVADCARLLVKPAKPSLRRRGRPAVNVERDRAICTAVAGGMSLANVARLHRITPGRVHVIVKDAGIKPPRKPVRRCDVDACGEVVLARGLCARHYMAQRRMARRQEREARAWGARHAARISREFLAQRIRIAMLEQNIGRLAEMCGITPDYLYLIRDGRYLPTPKILGRIELGLKRLRERREAAGDLIGWARSQAASIGLPELARRAGVSLVALSRFLARAERVERLSISRVENKLARYREKAPCIR